MDNIEPIVGKILGGILVYAPLAWLLYSGHVAIGVCIWLMLWGNNWARLYDED